VHGNYFINTFKDSFFSLLFINRDLEDLSPPPPQSSGQDSNELAWLIAGEDFISTNYEAPHESSCILLLLHYSLVKIFFSEPCSQTPSVYALPLV
jgi:hypothetical protein